MPFPAGAPAADIAAPGLQNGMGAYGYDSMGPYGYSSMGYGGYSSMSANCTGFPGLNRLRSMSPRGYTAEEGSLNTLGRYGSIGPGGMGTYGFMGASCQKPLGSLESMGPGAFGSVNDGMGGNMTADYGPLGGQPGSLYGMRGPMVSMYGIEVPMGSMHNLRGNLIGSMYSRGSMYGLGSMYTQGPYNRMGLGCNGGFSMHGISRITSRSSFRSSGGYVGGFFGGLWRAPSVGDARPKRDFSIPPPSSSLQEEVPVAKDDETSEDGTIPMAGDLGVRTATLSEASPTSVAEGKTLVVAVNTRDDKRNGLQESASEKSHEVAKDDKGRWRTKSLRMPSLRGSTKQINDNVHAIAVVLEESAVNCPRRSVTVGKVSYKMDEVVMAPLDVDSSDFLTDIIEQTHCGHNVSMLALCGAQPFVLCTNPITAVVKRVMESFAGDKAQLTQVRASAVAFEESAHIVDLLEANARPVKAEMGYNPVYGPCVVNTSERDVKSAEEAVEVVTSTVTKAGGQGLVVILYKIKQIRPATMSGAALTKDVYVSSMLVAMVDDANMPHLRMAGRHTATEPELMFTNAIGGASRTVAIVQVPVQNAEKWVSSAAAYSQYLRVIRNTPMRSGNMKRFIDYIERAAAANTTASPETTARIRQMFTDANELLARPEETPLVAYRLFCNRSVTTLPNARPHSDVSASESVDPPETRAAENGAPVRARANAAAAGKLVSTATTLPAAMLTSEPESERQVRLVVCVDGATAIPAGRMKANEVVVRANTSEVPESDMLKTLRGVFRSGRNIALLTAETQSSIPLKDQYTWMCVADILKKALESPPAHAKYTCIELFMCVVLKHQVLCDAMVDRAASAVPKPLDTASSPLFGPVFASTAYRTLRHASEVKPSLVQALHSASTHLADPDSMVVMTAVLKQQQVNGDVFVASFMALSGVSTAGLRDAVSNNPDYPRSFLSYAIGGPSVTSLLLCVGRECALSEAAKVSLTDMQVLTKQRNLQSREGSVMAFIDYTKKALEGTKLRLEKAQGEDRERLTTVLKQLQIMHDDYRALLQFPMENIPAYYVGEKRVSPAPRKGGEKSEEVIRAAAPAQDKPQVDALVKKTAPIRAVVVVMYDDEDASSVPEPTPMEVTEKELVVNGQRYTPTEVVQAKGGSFRSAVVDEMHKIVLEGYNAGMLTSDIGGSTVGISMAVKTITTILRGLSKDSEAFWSATVSKAGKVKDMLAEHSSYYDLHVASSPLFGNVPYGASIVSVAEMQVMPKVREVRNEVLERGGLGYIALILRIVQSNGDVCVPSLTVTIAGDQVDEYERVVSTRNTSALLGSAIGGACNSIYVAGILGKSGELAQPVLQLATKMMRVHNGPLRSGSLKRFIAHTEPVVAAMQRNIEARGGAISPQLVAQVSRIGTMVNDAQSMLSSPGGRIPAVYRR